MKLYTNVTRPSTVKHSLSFFRRGFIRISTGVSRHIISMLEDQNISIDSNLYLHIYTIDTGSKDSYIGICIDDDEVAGIRIYKQKKGNYFYFHTYAKHIVDDLCQLYDWPLSENKLNMIRYIYSGDVVEIGGKKILKFI